MRSHARNLQFVGWAVLVAFNALAIGTPPSASAAGYICAEGGGGLSKGHWAGPVFQWMMDHGGQKRVVVLGYHVEPDESVERVFRNAGASSVTHLLVADRITADAPATGSALEKADIIWMRGGDQSKYVKNWRGTRTEAAIRSVYQRGGVIGGTSAGAAVLGEVIYDAFNGSLQSEAALANAYDPVLTLTTGFLSLTPGVLFDTHFTERGRIGRLAVMLARRYEDAQQDLIGVGLDYRTALCVNPDLMAEVRGEGTVTFIHRTSDTKQIALTRQPAAITDLQYDQLTAGFQYDLKSRRITAFRSPASSTNAAAETPPHAEAAPAQPRFVHVILDGADPAAEAFGQWQVFDGGDRSALFKGAVAVMPAESRLRNAVVMTQTWSGQRPVENTVGGAEWAVASHPGALAILLASQMQAECSSPGVLAMQGRSPHAPSAILLDGRTMRIVDLSSIASDPLRNSLRQAAVIVNARLHILAPGMYYNAQLSRPILLRRKLDLNADDEINRADLLTFADLATGAAPASWQLTAADANGDHDINDDDTAPFIAAVLESSN